MSYTVRHLHGGHAFERPSILLNEHQKHGDCKQHIDPAIEEFHKTLPQYGETKLFPLPAVASELGFEHVFIKDESERFGLPSFKILGASWAIQRAISQQLNLSKSTSLQSLSEAMKGREIRLVTCTEGNWGRAVARMAKYLSIPVTIYVPGFMNEYTRNLIRGEGADLQVLQDGSYDDSIAAAQHDAATTKALMVMDTSWEGYVEIPRVSSPMLVLAVGDTNTCKSGCLMATAPCSEKQIDRYARKRKGDPRISLWCQWVLAHGRMQ